MVALCKIIIIIKTIDEFCILLLQIRKNLTIIPISKKTQDSRKIMGQNKKYDCINYYIYYCNKY